MTEANVNDPSSVERIYTLDDFQRDAGINSLGKTPVLHGLRILSQPGPDGSFKLARADRQAGERDPEGDTAFLAPFLRQGMAVEQGNAYAGSKEPDDAPGQAQRPSDDYAAFVVRVLETARTIRFKRPIGRDEERLHGFHGG